MASTRKNKSQPPPSRRRYEESHPGISARVSREVYDAVVALKRSQGLSFSDLILIGLGKAKPDLDAAWEKGTEWGHEIGYEAGQIEFEVTYWCNACGRRHLSITSDEEKDEAAKMMFRAGWHDLDCQPR